MKVLRDCTCCSIFLDVYIHLFSRGRNHNMCDIFPRKSPKKRRKCMLSCFLFQWTNTKCFVILRQIIWYLALIRMLNKISKWSDHENIKCELHQYKDKIVFHATLSDMKGYRGILKQCTCCEYVSKYRAEKFRCPVVGKLRSNEGSAYFAASSPNGK